MLDFLDDLDADFRVYYRIDGVGDEQFPPGLSGPRFFALACRCSAYPGSMASVLAEKEDKPQPATRQPGPAPATGDNLQRVPGRSQPVQMVPSDGNTLATHPALAGIVEYSRGGDGQ